MPINRSLSNSEKQTFLKMQVQTQEDKIEQFLQRKFRVSRSYCTKRTYLRSIKNFIRFVRAHYNLDLNQILRQLETKEHDPITVLDDYYSYLANYKLPNSTKVGYSNASIILLEHVAKEFLNSQGCKIYQEDLKQRFRLPRRIQVYEEGLTKEKINRILRLAKPKLSAAILICCSSGMRIGELVQLKLNDIDFTKTPTTITIRKETTKTRETRITCISSEATSALQDYLQKLNTVSEYPFLGKHDPTNEERYADAVSVSIHTLEKQLIKIIQDIPELYKKNDNGRNQIHFHAFRAWFKTQVTDAHESDFAEALMGHKSLKLVYYRQNTKARAQTYLDVEYSLTIADTEKIDENYSELQKDNLELRGIVDNLSRQLRNLEKRIEIKS